MANMVDEKDQEIIRMLGKNARITNTEIANSLGISEATVRNRIKKLVANRIIQNIAIINPKTMGYHFHAHIGVQVDYQNIENITKKLKKLDAVYFLGFATGRYDLIIFCFFRNPEEQLNFLTEQLARINGIKRIETLQILKILKANYIWGFSLADRKESLPEVS